MKSTYAHLLRTAILAGLVAIIGAGATSVSAQTIIEEWSTVKAPPAPALKPVTVDPKTTALLVMDLLKQGCNDQRRPRCVASISAIEKLIAAARAKGMMVIFSTIPPISIGDTLAAVAPKANEPIVVAWVDKFMLGNKDTGLEKMLKDKGITTVISVGTASYGAVLYTSSAAALRGLNVVVPVDGMSSEDLYFDQASAWLLAKGTGGIGPKVTLTKIDMIKF
jgi:nicotinamidase-related amidase